MSEPVKPNGNLATADDVLGALIAMVNASERIVAFTGAGISTESGIPDYRGPGGVWERGTPPQLDDFLNNPETRREYWERRRVSYPELRAKKPNAGHLALAEMEWQGVLIGVITQNIDGLHQKAGNAPAHVIELHGTAHKIRCLECGRSWDAEIIQERLLAGESEPACVVCGGMLRAATILFGEALPPDALKRAVEIAQTCDLMLVIGSSLIVNPAAKLPLIARQAGAKIAIINRTLTPLDTIADLVVSAEAGPTLSSVANALPVPEE
ncbi:MAG: SIR2 family NAD-dependent protein deacylase [Thermomicrobiales bacterium]